MSFANSDALFPSPVLAAVIGAEYENQCRLLCYGPFPTWDQVQAKFMALRPLL
ncbi:MAG: hypothetical protein JNM18_09665 [Planctomycetaceae bacterium]|nr:hypothetical protein [Planctomycetaceae bacterium]